MAQTATPNYHFQFHLRGASVCVQLTSPTRSHNLGQFQDVMSTRQPIFAFLVAVLLSFLQVKFQGKTESPFETHPNLTWLAILTLLLYCLAYDAKLRISTNRHPSSLTIHRARSIFICSGMAFFGPLSLASLLSILLPERLLLLPFSVAILFALSQLPLFRLIKTIWNWLKELIGNRFCAQPQRRVRLTGFVQINALAGQTQ